MAAIGIPETLISSILLNGTYKPNLGKNKTEKDPIEEDDGFVEEGNPNPDKSLVIENANDETLTAVIRKLQKIIKELLIRWDLRQIRTDLQNATMQAFGKLHDSDNINDMFELLQIVISKLPSNQSELFDAQLCYPGFLSWNNFWKASFSRENVGGDIYPLKNVHKYYEEWFKISKEKDLPFTKLWENLMIRSTSEAICETIGSMMVQHGAKNRNLKHNNFNIEMYLRFNLGPLHLSDGLINEILAFDTNKTYLRVGTDPNRLTTKNVHKSSGVGGFEKRDETKSRLPQSFWSPTSSSSK